MRKYSSHILLFLTMLVVIFMLKGEDVSAASTVKLNKTSKTMDLGTTYTLKLTGTKSKIKWSSSNKSIVSVNSSGLITAKSVGNASITAKVGKKKYKCEVNVIDPYADSIPLSTAKQQSVTMVAHRGMSSVAPENTIPAIEMACIYGYNVIEFDVRQTVDGKFIVLHDAKVDKMTNGEGRISQMTLEEIQNLKIDNGKGISRYKNLKIPTLEEVLNCCKKYGAIPLIDMKSVSDTDKLLKIVKKYGFSSKGMITGSDIKLLSNIKKKNKKISIYLIGNTDAATTINTAKKYKFSGVNLKYSTVNETIKTYTNQKDISVMIWDVDSVDRFNICSSYSPNFILTDGIIK